MINGVLNIRKEPGMTSFGVVARIRRIFGQKKVGHTGTLDPDAEGVLPVCLGKATKLVETLSLGTKTYEAVLLLGLETDTQDTSGEVQRTADVTCTEAEAEEAVRSFEGTMQQMPPMYSALKVNGQKLVDLARKGIEVERRTREVTFSEMEILSVELPRITFRVTCTHGAYIRTLCHDIGRKLGCGGAMEHLNRTRVGVFAIENAFTIDEIAAMKEREDELSGQEKSDYSFLMKIDRFYTDLPAYLVSGKAEKLLLNGNAVSVGELKAADDNASQLAEGEKARIYLGNGDFVGIYRREGELVRLVQFFYDDGQGK